MSSLKYLHDQLVMLDPTLYIALQETRAVTSFLHSLHNMETDPQTALAQTADPTRYDYLVEVLDEEFSGTAASFRTAGILTYEVDNLLRLCAPVFDSFGFPEQDEVRMMRYAIIGTISDYLEREPEDGI